MKGKEDVTLKGKKIHLYANVGNVSDVMTALENDASGIGLFRSEFLYLEKDHYPTEEDQFHVYKTVAETMAGKKVIIRTLDIGADKQIDYFDMEPEENPAMGYRAIRICLDREDMFKTQIRAIYRASAYGNIGIMYPMIISVDEVKRIKEISASVRRELSEAGISFGDVEEGIMIETPAAAIISDLLAKEVDFSVSAQTIFLNILWQLIGRTQSWIRFLMPIIRQLCGFFKWLRIMPTRRASGLAFAVSLAPT